MALHIGTYSSFSNVQVSQHFADSHRIGQNACGTKRTAPGFLHCVDLATETIKMYLPTTAGTKRDSNYRIPPFPGDEPSPDVLGSIQNLWPRG